ncbi:MAG: phosphoribosyl-ATP pyrophosphohydrolase / phosphoribosyl-AMP cyclohydrolase [Ignavibacteria bacterium]|nr:MAG: phosphoribosyl-ATP pyrophosphohydrolase / phosphoribosyl-AMP cyclohydrolase [Ignavibacteria bacterium]KAF0159898.1 MAG: phosphoribosyl-ATP pyrophosphohydrolase / phosphoribosyl-AMP cyclohydrolase [Ignavibacteria bacterium]
MIDKSKLNYEKLCGLIPAIVVDINSDAVLMLGFMNEEALELTLSSKKVTFFSRTKNALWVKGETSGNYLELSDIKNDCDNDTLLVYAKPQGPTCHTGEYSCFGVKGNHSKFLLQLYELIKNRKMELPEGSYTTRLFHEGTNKIIQKVGEEAIETVIAAKNRNRKEIINEVSDLFYHLFVMLAEQDIEFDEIIENLYVRNKKLPQN